MKEKLYEKIKDFIKEKKGSKTKGIEKAIVVNKKKLVFFDFGKKLLMPKIKNMKKDLKIFFKNIEKLVEKEKYEYVLFDVEDEFLYYSFNTDDTIEYICEELEWYLEKNNKLYNYYLYLDYVKLKSLVLKAIKEVVG